jgi:predicted transcriptional regulator of viral defense system
MTEAKPNPSRTEKLQRLYELAASQAGYFTAAQARGLGYTPRGLHHHVAAGHLERVRRGFYRLVGVPSDPHEDVVAAWLRFASRRAVVSHDTALVLYDLEPSRSHEIHLTMPRGHRPRNRQSETGIRLHTTVEPLRRNEVANRFGVLVTSPARTVADIAEVGVEPGVVVQATARALAIGLVTPDELRAAVKRRSARVRRLVERAIGEAGARA